MSNNKKFGDRGEEVAKKYLQNKGYFLIEKNYATVHGEIDLIMRDRDTIVFVEVKSRRGITYGYPEEAVTKNKLGHIKKALYEFKNIHVKYNKLRFRIDVIAILYDSMKESEISPEITHLTHIGY